jgi:hypothetical protein
VWNVASDYKVRESANSPEVPPRMRMEVLWSLEVYLVGGWELEGEGEGEAISKERLSTVGHVEARKGNREFEREFERERGGMYNASFVYLSDIKPATAERAPTVSCAGSRRIPPLDHVPGH